MNLDLGLFKIKNKKNVSNPRNLLIEILAEESMNQSVSNLNISSTLARAKLPTTDLTMNRTISFNYETSMIIRSCKKSEFDEPNNIIQL
jgi:hypothetical protein